MAIAVQSDPKDIEDLKKIFQELDKDGNGSITLEELQFGLGDRENAEDLIEIMKGADTDGSGAINYTGKYTYVLNFGRVFGGNDERADIPKGRVS